MDQKSTILALAGNESNTLVQEATSIAAPGFRTVKPFEKPVEKGAEPEVLLIERLRSEVEALKAELSESRKQQAEALAELRTDIERCLVLLAKRCPGPEVTRDLQRARAELNHANTQLAELRGQLSRYLNIAPLRAVRALRRRVFRL